MGGRELRLLVLLLVCLPAAPTLLWAGPPTPASGTVLWYTHPAEVANPAACAEPW